MSQFPKYLALADAIADLADRIAGAAGALLRDMPTPHTLRNRALIGLVVKIDAAFRALMDDARARRSEAMHHLKTMAEAYIYFHVILDDATDASAELVLARALDLRATMLAKSDHGEMAQAEQARHLRDQLLRGRKVPKHRILDLAREHDVEAWYWTVYSLACEPAHLGDLIEFMPWDDWVLHVGSQRPPSTYRATVALHYGIGIALATLDAIGAANELGLTIPTGELRRQFDNIASGGDIASSGDVAEGGG